MQGEIMLISITIVLLFNFEKNILYVFLFSSKRQISFPSVFTVNLVLDRKTEKKNVTSNLNKFCLHVVARLRSIARIAMARCTREAKFKAVQRHYIKIYQSNFLLCCINLSSFNIFENWG